MTERQQELLRAIRALMLEDKTPTLDAIAERVGATNRHSIYNSIRAMRASYAIGEDNRPLDNALPGRIVAELGKWVRTTDSNRIPVALLDRIMLLTDDGTNED